jgi:O-antigen ligase
MHALAKQIDYSSKILLVATAFILPFSTALTNIAFIGVAILCLLAGNYREKLHAILHNPVAILMLAFFLMFVIGISYSTASFHDSLAMAMKYDRILFAVIFLPQFQEAKWRNYALNAFLAAMLIVLCLSLIKAIGLLPWDYESGPVEVFRGHIAFNFLMGFTAYLLLLRIVDAKTKFCRLLFIVLWLLVVFDTIFLCIGRSGYVVLVALILLFCLQHLNWKGLLLAFCGICLLGAVAYEVAPNFKQRIDLVVHDLRAYQVDKNQDTSLGDRYNFATNSILLLKAHPILGTGTGSFSGEYAKIQPTPKVLTHNPHNEYLLMGVQFGAVGICLLLLLFGVQLWESKKLPGEMRYIAQAVVLAIALGSLANSWLLDTTQGHFYAYFIALTFGALDLTL